RSNARSPTTASTPRSTPSSSRPRPARSATARCSSSPSTRPSASAPASSAPMRSDHPTETHMKLPSFPGWKARIRLAPAAAACGALALSPLPALAQDAAAAPGFDRGDVAWMLTSTLLVLLMTVPGLALFYGGLVRAKNVLSVLSQVLVVFSLVLMLWVAYGYSAVFSAGNAFF